MRLIEEKSLMALEAVALLLILLSSFLIEFSQDKIDAHNNQIQMVYMDIIRFQNLSSIWSQHAQNAEIHKLGIALTNDKSGYKQILASKGASDAVIDKLIEQWKKGDLTLKEFIGKKAEYYSKRAIKAALSQNNKSAEYKTLISQPSPFRGWKRIFQVVHVFSIFASAFGYLLLARNIHKRYSKKGT